MSRPPQTVDYSVVRSMDPPGQGARRLAIYAIDAILTRGRALDEAFNEGVTRLHLERLEGRDRAFARLVVSTTLRRLGQLEAVVTRFLEKPLKADSGRTMMILTTTAAQLLFLDTPPHAAISQAVEIARIDHTSRRFDKLVNAVLRKVSTEGQAILATLDGVRLDTPEWLWQRWTAHYGETTARMMAAASLSEAALDLSVKNDPAHWAAELTGIVMPTGTVRVREAGRIEDLPGYADGAWWVQDAAAALPVRLFGNVAGQRVADLCAAPGGKTAQLAAAGANVVAVESSAKRLQRLAANLTRLKLTAETITADAAEWSLMADNAGAFDAVLLDAPCSATGTIRRHPDLLRAKAETEVQRMSQRQRELLAAAAHVVRPGGTLVYATCSLEPEEGEQVIAAFLAANPAFEISRLDAAVLGLPHEIITAEGHLRTLPQHALGPEPAMAGMDGFFAARLLRTV